MTNINKSQQVLNLFTNTDLSKDLLEYLVSFLEKLKTKFDGGIWSDVIISKNFSSFNIVLNDVNSSFNYEQVNKIFNEHMSSFRLKKQLSSFLVKQNNIQFDFIVILREPYYRIWNYKLPYSMNKIG